MTCQVCPNHQGSGCSVFKKRTESDNWCVVSDRDPQTFRLYPDGECQRRGRGGTLSPEYLGNLTRERQEQEENDANND